MKRLLIVGLVTVASLSAAPAMASSIDLTMTNIGLGSNGVMGGAYIGPYTVQVNGTTNTFQVICDQFLADTYVGESWTASITSLSSLNSQLYNEIGYLAEALFAGSTSCQTSSCAGVNYAADIQYAIWQVFDGAPALTGGAFAYLTGNDLANAQGWLIAAQSQTYTPGQFSDLVIYTPTSCLNTVGCSSTNLPQEFIGKTSVPEPATVLLLLVAMAGTFGYQYRFNRARTNA